MFGVPGADHQARTGTDASTRFWDTSCCCLRKGTYCLQICGNLFDKGTYSNRSSNVLNLQCKKQLQCCWRHAQAGTWDTSPMKSTRRFATAHCPQRKVESIGIRMNQWKSARNMEKTGTICPKLLDLAWYKYTYSCFLPDFPAHLPDEGIPVAFLACLPPCLVFCCQPFGGLGRRILFLIHLLSPVFLPCLRTCSFFVISIWLLLFGCLGRPETQEYAIQIKQLWHHHEVSKVTRFQAVWRGYTVRCEHFQTLGSYIANEHGRCW